jgi:hypothetical protein
MAAVQVEESVGDQVDEAVQQQARHPVREVGPDQRFVGGPAQEGLDLLVLLEVLGERSRP